MPTTLKPCDVRLLAEYRVGSVQDVRTAPRALVQFSPGMMADLGVLRRFLYERMYRHYRVNRTRSQARRILAEMFSLFMAEPEVLPTEWFVKSQNRDDAGRVVDFHALRHTFISNLADGGAGFFVEHPGAAHQLDAMEREPAGYIAHEFLGAHWQPQHVADVIRAFARVDCSFLGSATPIENIDALSIPGRLQARRGPAHRRGKALAHGASRAAPSGAMAAIALGHRQLGGLAGGRDRFPVERCTH